MYSYVTPVKQWLKLKKLSFKSYIIAPYVSDKEYQLILLLTLLLWRKMFRKLKDHVVIVHAIYCNEKTILNYCSPSDSGYSALQWYTVFAEYNH